MATVVPSLPLLEVSTSLPKSTGFSSMADSECVVSSALMTLYAGQRYSLSLLLTGFLRHNDFSMLCSPLTLCDNLCGKTETKCIVQTCHSYIQDVTVIY